MASVLLMGPPGSGKSRSLCTLLNHPKHPYTKLICFVTEPGGSDVLRANLNEEQLSRCHFKTILPAALDFKSLGAIFKTIHSLTFEGLTQMKGGIGKEKFTQFLDVVAACGDFTSDEGIHFGNIGDLPSEYILVFDSMSGLVNMVLDMTTGARDARAPGEWNVAQGTLTRFLQTVFAAREDGQLRSLVVFTAHVDREANEVTGQTTISPSAVGAKMGPRLGRLFGDVVLSRRTKNIFTWDTIAEQTDTKFRLLPAKADLTPSFWPILEQLHLGEELIKQQTIGGVQPAI